MRLALVLLFGVLLLPGAVKAEDGPPCCAHSWAAPPNAVAGGPTPTAIRPLSPRVERAIQRQLASRLSPLSRADDPPPPPCGPCPNLTRIFPKPASYWKAIRLRLLHHVALSRAARLQRATAPMTLAGLQPNHRSGCHRWHTCPSDHATYRWRGWLCVAPYADERNSSFSHRVRYQGRTYYCRR